MKGKDTDLMKDCMDRGDALGCFPLMSVAEGFQHSQHESCLQYQECQEEHSRQRYEDRENQQRDHNA